MKNASLVFKGLAAIALAGLLTPVLAGAQSSTVVLETGYTDRGQVVDGTATPVAPGAALPAGERSVANGAEQPVNNLPSNEALPAGSTPVDAALVPPGTLVVAPGNADAPRARAAGPAAALDLGPDNGAWLTMALLAVAALAPLAGLLWVLRRKKPRAARSHVALAQALAAAIPVEKAPAEPAPRLTDRLRDAVAGGLSVAAPKRARSDVGRELAEALRRGPEAAPEADEAELVQLRQEVLEGLREMKTRVAEFTEALEIGKDELQRELARADRAVQLLRAEREGLEPSSHLAPHRSIDRLAEPAAPAQPMTVKTPLAAIGPMAFRPPRVEPASPGPRRPAPSLDPAWLLLEDEGDGLWSPPSDAAEETAAPRHAAPTRVPTPMGVSAVRALAARPAAAAVLMESEDPRERRRRVVEMARSGRSIDEISRELHVGRGEVTLALSRAR